MIDQPRIALLVDAENVNVEQASFALRDAEKRGIVTIRRAFGDFFRPHLSGWKPFLTEEAFSVEVALSAVAKKDTADLLLAQHAIRLAERRAVEMIALVSSDSDFGAIARSVSESGAPVIGYGRKGVPESWTRACALFVEFPEKAAKAEKAPDAEKLRSTVLNLLRDGVDDEGWLRLSTLGGRLTRSLGKGYQRFFDAKSLTEVAEKYPRDLEIERREAEGAAPALYVRRRKR